MCVICKKFKRGVISVEEAREELEEQMEYLSEDHIEEMEHMLFEAEDTYDYMMENHRTKNADEDDEDYILEEDLHEEDPWEDEDE